MLNVVLLTWLVIMQTVLKYRSCCLLKQMWEVNTTRTFRAIEINTLRISLTRRIRIRRNEMRLTGVIIDRLQNKTMMYQLGI